MRIFVFMKTRLNITIEESLLEKVKSYAKEKKVSVSDLVEKYFETVLKSKPKKSRESILDFLEDMKSSAYPENFDFKKEYFENKKPVS